MITLNGSYGEHVKQTGTFSARGPWPGVWEKESISSDSVKLGNILLKSQSATTRFSQNSNICVWVKLYINTIYINIKEEWNILDTKKRKKAKWTRHILRRNCLLKHVIEGEIEGMIEVTVKRGRRCKQLLVELG